MSRAPLTDLPKTHSDQMGRRAVFGILLVASLLKLWWVCSSAGSVDAILFYNFADALERMGLFKLYAVEAKFNHTPLTSGFIVLLYRLANGEFLAFTLLLRLASIVADAALVIGLVRWRDRLGNPPWWALAIFAGSPVSLMISGFHGNVDPIMVALLFFAGVAAVLDRPAICGLLFGLACNVKIVPIVFGPVFFFYWLARGRAWRFMLPTAAILLGGSLAPLLVCPRVYLHNVFGYGSTWGVWGVPYLLRQTGWKDLQVIDFQGLSSAQMAIASVLKYTAVGGVLLLAWVRRAKWDVLATLGGAWLIFFVFAPGVGVQYMAWFGPFVLLLTPRGYTVLTVTAAMMMAVFYHITSGFKFPWFLAMPLGPEAPMWSAAAVLPWAAFLIVLWGNWRRLWFDAPPLSRPATAEPAQVT